MSQSEDLVCADHPSDALHHGPVVWCDTPDGGAAPNPTGFGCNDGALGEELGWSGYAIDPLQDRYGALRGALLLGVVWAVWHYVPLLEAPRSLASIVWWSLGTAAARVIIVWLYNNTGRSVFVAALVHTMMNLTWQLFPINGSYYDPRVTGLITAVVAVVVAIVWGPRTLARYRDVSMKRRA